MNPDGEAKAEADFLREAALLREEARKGSDYEKFATQLVRTITAFHGTEETMWQRHDPRWNGFEEALQGWEAARKI
jgi:hypothetical protein